MSNGVATLVSIPASNYVEKARWALQLTGIAFREEKWAPVFAYFSTKPKGGASVPLLVLPLSKSAVLTNSSDILDFCAQTKPDLYPNEDTKKLELYYDTELGPHTRCCAYFIVFKDKTVARNVLAKPLGRIQSFVTRLVFPILKGMLMHAMQINQPGAEESWSKVERLVKEAEERLGDAPIGSRFLTGDTFSAADISFCSHVGLILIPPEHSFLAPHFSVDAIPDSVFRERCQWLRESKAGQFVLWCYRNKRPPMQQTANL